MKKFIFITKEGSTIAPNGSIQINLMKVIGIVENASDEDDALTKLLQQNPWIFEAEFNVADLTAYEIVGL